MNNKILLGLVLCFGVLTAIASATLYNVDIDLDPKEDEWLINKMDKTGKNAGTLIEEDVKGLYNVEYDGDLSDQIVVLAEKCIEADYKIQKQCIGALDKIVG